MKPSKRIPCQILGNKTVKNVQIEQQTTDLRPVREGVSFIYVIREKISFRKYTFVYLQRMIRTTNIF